MRDILRRILGWLSHPRLGTQTPAERVYIVPYTSRTAIVAFTNRVVMVPRVEVDGVSAQFGKHENDVEDYVFEWLERLNGDALNSSEWEVVSGDLTIHSHDREGTQTTVWLSGLGKVANTVTTLGGRQWTRIMEFVESEQDT